MSERTIAISAKGSGRSNTKLLRFGVCMAVGLLVWVLPQPSGVHPNAWKTFAVFLFTLLGMVLKPIPTGAMTLVSLTILCATKVLTFSEAFDGFSSPTVWLIVLAFFFARGFIKTGLGLRIAYKVMSLVGRSTLGMAYGIVFTDLIMSTAIPSLTARAGGVIFPVVTSLSRAFDSFPDTSPRRLGAYLIQTVFQCGAITSAMFLTAMAGNPMIQNFAEGAGVTITWGTWALAAIVPGLASLALIPFVVYIVFPPEVKSTPEAQAYAKEKLKESGSITRDEWIMTFIFIGMVILWMLAPVIQMGATITALLGLVCLLLSGVLSWDEILQEKGAWDTLIWFASLIAIAGALNKFGLMIWFSDYVGGYVTGMNWVTGFGLIAILYYYSHYMFASNIAHITTMYAPFLLLSIAIGAPPMLAALILGFFSSLFGSLTTYGCGPAPIFFGAGYVSSADWWRVGFIISVVNIIVWLGLGTLWWRFLGLI